MTGKPVIRQRGRWVGAPKGCKKHGHVWCLDRPWLAQSGLLPYTHWPSSSILLRFAGGGIDSLACSTKRVRENSDNVTYILTEKSPLTAIPEYKWCCTHRKSAMTVKYRGPLLKWNSVSTAWFHPKSNPTINTHTKQVENLWIGLAWDQLNRLKLNIGH